MTNEKSKNIFDYLKEISELSELKNDNGSIILKKYYEKIDFISTDSALSLFLDNTNRPKYKEISDLIFPYSMEEI